MGIEEGIEAAIEQATVDKRVVRTADIVPLIDSLGGSAHGLQIMVGRALSARGWLRVHMVYEGARGHFFVKPWQQTPAPATPASAPSPMSIARPVQAPGNALTDAKAIREFNVRRREMGLAPVDAAEYARLHP